MASFAGYNFTPVTECMPIPTEWEFTTSSSSETANDDDKMMMFSAEEAEYLLSYSDNTNTAVDDTNHPATDAVTNTNAAAAAGGGGGTEPTATATATTSGPNEASASNNNTTSTTTVQTLPSPTVSPSSSVSSDLNSGDHLAVFGPWRASDDDGYDYDDDEDDVGLSDLYTTNRPLQELFNNALYFDNDEDRRHYHHHHDTIHDQQGFLAPLLNHVHDC